MKSISVLLLAFILYFPLGLYATGNIQIAGSPTAIAIPDTLVALETTVHSIYHDEWTDMMWFFSISVAVVGILVPAIFLVLQALAIKFQKDEFREMLSKSTAEMKASVEAAKNESIETATRRINASINETVKNTEKELSKFRKNITSSTKKLKEEIKKSEQNSESKIKKYADIKLDEFKNRLEDIKGDTFILTAKDYENKKDYYHAYGYFMLGASVYSRIQKDTGIGVCITSAYTLYKLARVNNFDNEDLRTLINVKKNIREGTSTKSKSFIPNIEEMENHVKKILDAKKSN